MAVSPTDVRVIITTALTDPSLQVLINTAERLVAVCLDGVTGISDDTKDDIAKYLSAHLVTVQSPRAESSRSSGHTVSFQGDTTRGLESSFYGQTTAALDPTGCLSAAFREKKMAFIFAALAGHEADNAARGEDLRRKFFDERTI